MTFKENLAADVTNVFLNADEFAEVVTFHANAADTVGVSATVVWHEDEERLARGANASNNYVRRATVEVDAKVATDPSEENWFTRGGDKYHVEEIGEITDMVEYRVAKTDVRDVNPGNSTFLTTAGS